MWTQHWVVPIYKKKQVFLGKHYRGVHLTAQLSKTVERVIGTMFEPFFILHGRYGRNQFAYQKKRGARDALAFLTLSWLWALSIGQKIAVYCSDVSGTLDKVRAERLIMKLQRAGVHPQLVDLLASWLRAREAYVVVE